jgi:hypothetical protein
MWRKENTFFVMMWICMDFAPRIREETMRIRNTGFTNKPPRNQDAASTVFMVSDADPDFLLPGSRSRKCTESRIPDQQHCC